MPPGPALRHRLPGCLPLKLRRENKVATTAVSVGLGVDVEGHRDVLGHWVGDGAERANFWLSVISDWQARGVKEILIACLDGLTGFKEAIQAVFPQTEILHGGIHPIRNSLKYISWKDRKAFLAALRRVYQAPTREVAQAALARLKAVWGGAVWRGAALLGKPLGRSDHLLRLPR